MTRRRQLKANSFEEKEKMVLVGDPLAKIKKASLLKI